MFTVKHSSEKLFLKVTEKIGISKVCVRATQGCVGNFELAFARSFAVREKE
jgi:hypothetical protein